LWCRRHFCMSVSGSHGTSFHNWLMPYAHGLILYVLSCIHFNPSVSPTQETAHFPTTSPSSPLPSPLPLTCTCLPAVWNTVLLCISTNSRLEQIILSTSVAARGHACTHALGVTPMPNLNLGGTGNGNWSRDDDAETIPGKSLFIMEARKYARLGELIRRAVKVGRGRTHAVVIDVVGVG